MDNKLRARKYLLTINNPDTHNVSHQTIKDALKNIQIKYYAICDETGSNGTYHYHVYLYFNNSIQISTLKKKFPTAHIDVVKGTSLENKKYLLKSAPEHNKAADGSYSYTDSSGKEHSGVNHTDTFEEFGECPTEQPGKRNDLEQLYSLVKDGYSNAEILEICGATAIKHIDKLNKLRHDYLVDKYIGSRRLDLKVHYITGKTGTGKSRDILNEYSDENCYRVTDYKHPFDSYQLNSVLVFEEFRSSLKLQDMLNYLDIYPVILPARYSPRVGCFTTVFVVSNWDFEQQFAELQKDPEQKSSYEAWVRRFNGYVKEYYADGKYNFYPTMQDYLKRNEQFRPVTDESVPFTPDAEPEQVNLPDSTTDTDVNNEPMPFD